MLARNRYDTDIPPLLVEPICIIAGRYRHSVHYRRKTVIEKSYHISFFRNEAAFMYRWGYCGMTTRLQINMVCVGGGGGKEGGHNRIVILLTFSRNIEA